MARGRQDDTFRPHWLVVTFEASSAGVRSPDAPASACTWRGQTIGLLFNPTGVSAVLQSVDFSAIPSSRAAASSMPFCPA